MSLRVQEANPSSDNSIYIEPSSEIPTAAGKLESVVKT